MRDRAATYKQLAAALPDIPRWLETRCLLLDGEGELLGYDKHDPASYIVRDPVSDEIFVVGTPGDEAVHEAAYRNRGSGILICQSDIEERIRTQLPGWLPSPATLFLLGDGARLPEVPPSAVRFVSITEIAAVEEMSVELKEQLKAATLWSPVAATIVDGLPVSFCYSGSETESLWDISIDTLERYRRRGFAGMAVAHMVTHMHERRKRPVWAAEESNVASMSLARKLGFVPVDRLLVFHPPGE